MTKKRNKKAPEAVPQEAPAPVPQEAPTTIAESIFDEALSFILQEIRDIKAKKDEPEEQNAKHDSASRIAWLAKNAAQVAAEQRKAEKAELEATKKLSPSMVMNWIKSRTPEERTRLVRDITAIDTKEKRSVLG